MIPPTIWIGLCGVLAWIVIVTHAACAPSRRLWPPRHRPGPLTLMWSWGFTILIYVGVIQTGLIEGNRLKLPDVIRWGLGGGMALMGSALQSWGVAALGLSATAGFARDGSYPPTPISIGPYRYMRHPQYVGQAVSLVGLALASGGLWVWGLTVAALLAFIAVARLESLHLRTTHASTS